MRLFIEIVYVYMKHFTTTEIEELSKALKIGTRTLYRLIADLHKQGFAEKIGVSKEPHWVLKNG